MKWAICFNNFLLWFVTEFNKYNKAISNEEAEKELSRLKVEVCSNEILYNEYCMQYIIDMDFLNI